MTNRHKLKQNFNRDIIFISLLVAVLISVNVISKFLFFRIDLTEEKRYTLSHESRDILKNLEDVVYIKVYLEGDLNIPFRKFRNNIQDMLDEFKIYGKSNLEYSFINPFEGSDKTKEKQIINDLYKKGLKPSNIYERDKEGGTSEKIVFPCAMISYRSTEIPVNLLLNNPGADGAENINNSVEEIEYTLISTIKNITNKLIDKIAFIEGHGELNEYDVHDISQELSKSYQIDRGIINGQPGILDAYKAIVIARPNQKFGEKDKFIIDQYIMKGGKVVWLIDGVQVSLDSLIEGRTVALGSELNIDDMLFRYGVRINPVLVQDIQCNVIPVNVAMPGNAPNFQPAPWFYYPLVVPPKDHPVTENLSPVLCRFVSNIDTLEARKNIRKTPLLITSPYTRIKEVPAIISLDEIEETPEEKDFNRGILVTGILLEGIFESVFQNRGITEYFNPAPTIVSHSGLNRMAIFADGDLIKNEVTHSDQGPVVQPLGYDRYTRQTFGNKELLVNLIQYLADDNNLLKLRSRKIKLRLLNKERLTAQRKTWILINMICPSLIIVLTGIVYIRMRKLKYTKS